jgi:hypothetical protein
MKLTNHSGRNIACVGEISGSYGPYRNLLGGAPGENTKIRKIRDIDNISTSMSLEKYTT